MPGLYYLDFDQISILDLALEVCDVVSQDLFVTLLPVIKDHPACKVIYDWNTMHQGTGADDNKKDMIAGIIKLNAIDSIEIKWALAVKVFIVLLYFMIIYYIALITKVLGGFLNHFFQFLMVYLEILIYLDFLFVVNMILFLKL